MKIGNFTSRIQKKLNSRNKADNLISVIKKSRDKVSHFQLICFSSGHMPRFQSPNQCSKDSGKGLPETEAKEFVPQKCSAGEKELKYKPAYFKNKRMGFSPSCATAALD